MDEEAGLVPASISGAVAAALACAALVAAVLRWSPPAEPTAVRFQTLWLPGVPVIWLGVPFGVWLGWQFGPLAARSVVRSAVAIVSAVLLAGTTVGYLLAVDEAFTVGAGPASLVDGLDPALIILATLVIWLAPYLMVLAVLWSLVVHLVSRRLEPE